MVRVIHFNVRRRAACGASSQETMSATCVLKKVTCRRCRLTAAFRRARKRESWTWLPGNFNCGQNP